MYAYTFSSSGTLTLKLLEICEHGIGKTICASLLVSGALVACGGGGSSEAFASAPLIPTLPSQSVGEVLSIKPGNWVVMGSSTAAGAGASAQKGWVALLQAERAGKGDVLVNIAKSGASTYEALGTVSVPVLNRPYPDPAINIDQALARKPVLLIVAFPSNDTAAGYSVDETVNNLLAIRARARVAAVPVIFVSTQPRALSISQLFQLREIDERVMKEVGGCFVPVRAKLAGADDKLASAYDSGDGAHPNDRGHLLIANAVSSVLRSGACVQVSS